MKTQNLTQLTPELPAVEWTTFTHEIDLTEARELIGRHKRENPGSISAVAFGLKAFERILSQKGCVGIRCYFGLKADGLPTLVLVGLDEFGNDMDEGELAEYATPCPPICPMDSLLDS